MAALPDFAINGLWISLLLALLSSLVRPDYNLVVAALTIVFSRNNDFDALKQCSVLLFVSLILDIVWFSTIGSIWGSKDSGLFHLADLQYLEGPEKFSLWMSIFNFVIKIPLTGYIAFKTLHGGEIPSFSALRTSMGGSGQSDKPNDGYDLTPIQPSVKKPDPRPPSLPPQQRTQGVNLSTTPQMV